MSRWARNYSSVTGASTNPVAKSPNFPRYRTPLREVRTHVDSFPRVSPTEAQAYARLGIIRIHTRAYGAHSRTDPEFGGWQLGHYLQTARRGRYVPRVRNDTIGYANSRVTVCIRRYNTKVAIVCLSSRLLSSERSKSARQKSIALRARARLRIFRNRQVTFGRDGHVRETRKRISVGNVRREEIKYGRPIPSPRHGLLIVSLASRTRRT